MSDEPAGLQENNGRPEEHGEARVLDLYGGRVAEHQRVAEEARRRRNALSWIRLVVFLLCAYSIYRAFTAPAGRPIWVVGGLLLLGIFIYLVRRQREAEEIRARSADLARLNAEAIARVKRSWSALPLPLASPGLTASALARDLGLIGRGSLLQLLGTVRSAEGRRIIGDWLVAEPSPEQILERQRAVSELAPLLEMRQEIERLAARTPQQPGALEPFHSWAATESWLASWRGLTLVARLLPAVTILLIALFLAGALATPLWLAMLPFHALLWVATAPRAGGELAHLEMRAGDLDRFASIFGIITAARFSSPLLLSLQRDLRSEQQPAEVWLRKLAQLVEFAEVRTTPLLYIPLQLVTLWDLHLISFIDRWRRQVGSRTRRWLEVVGELEALSALASLSFDNPEWAMPEVDPTAERWSATSLGHPMIPSERRVSNDVELGPPGTFLLVTGSNMSGKSTLMRAMGVNIALAQAGGPVCADAMRIPPTKLGTAFIIEDSLEDGVSYFMAELRRLKEIVDEAHEHRSAPSRYLFLLDEILKGTNSGERQIAVRRILHELLESRAAGAITTHDLALAEVEELTAWSVPVHFKEIFLEVGGTRTMHFDYRLHDGVATTTNALALLEMVGIRDSSDVPAARGKEDHPEPMTGRVRPGSPLDTRGSEP